MAVRTQLWGALGVGLCLFAGVIAAEPLRVTVEDQQGARVPGAVVALPGAEATAEPASTGPAVMDQIDMQFVPKVLAVPAGTRVRFPNSDDTRHHVYSFSPAKRFELALYQGDEAPPVMFDQPGVVVLGCNIHDSMIGYIYVARSPVFAKTDAEGRAVLPEHRTGGGEAVVVWHYALAEPLRLTRDDFNFDRGSATVTLPVTLPESELKPESSGLRNRLQRSGDDED